MHIAEPSPPRRGVCPWWLIRSFDNPLRRLVQKPDRILQDMIRPDDHCLDIGCGYGYFTIPMAELAGTSGSVTAADLQPHMLAGVKRRAEKAGLLHHVRPQRDGTQGSESHPGGHATED